MDGSADGEERPEIDRPLLVSLFAGAAVAAVFLLVGFPRWVLSTLAVLFHETGHAAAAWLFGRPAIPKFDLAYGGGFTSMEERSGIVLAGVAAGWAWLAWSRRGDRAALVAVLAAAGIWALLAFTGGGEVTILLAGHGGEVILGTVFLWRGLTGGSVVHRVERPLYTGVGAAILLQAGLFAGSLLSNAWAREEYEAGKGGILPNDFVQAADLLHTRLDAVVVAFLLACLAAPVAAAAGWWRRDLLARAWERLKGE